MAYKEQNYEESNYGLCVTDEILKDNGFLHKTLNVSALVLNNIDITTTYNYINSALKIESLTQ